MERTREKPELPESFKATIDLLRELEDYATDDVSVATYRRQRTAKG